MKCIKQSMFKNFR